MSLRGKLVVFWMKHRPKHTDTTQMVALMFAAIILLGTLLLMLDWRIALVCWSLFAVLWLMGVGVCLLFRGDPHIWKMDGEG